LKKLEEIWGVLKMVRENFKGLRRAEKLEEV